MRTADLIESQDAELLRDTVRRSLAEATDADATLAELGMGGLGLPESCGGSPCTPAELQAVLEEIGRAGGLAAYPGALAVALFITNYGNATRCKELLEGIAAGRTKIALAEAVSSPDLTLIVEGGDKAEVILVVLTGSGEPKVALVPTSALETASPSRPRVDGVTATTFEAIEDPGAYLLEVQAGIDVAAALTSINRAIYYSVLLGLCDRMLEQTNEYVRVRQQFGRPISKFQTIQHALAGMWVDCEEMRSLGLTLRPILSGDSIDETALDLAWLAATNRARRVAQCAIQLHGAMGIAEEGGIAPLFRRVWFLTTRHGGFDKGTAALEAALLEPFSNIE